MSADFLFLSALPERHRHRFGEIREHQVERDTDAFTRAEIRRHIVLEPSRKKNQASRLRFQFDEIRIVGILLVTRRHDDLGLRELGAQAFVLSAELGQFRQRRPAPAAV